MCMLKNRTEFKPHAKVVSLLVSQFREPKISMWDGESIRVQPETKAWGVLLASSLPALREKKFYTPSTPEGKDYRNCA